MSAEDQPIRPVPPGQALAHMFAKAERLEPGTPSDFETRLSDWVQLYESGEYQLEGRYTGVLPEQTPQIPGGLDLWREAAVTPTVRVRLTSVADYLSQRSESTEARGLSLELAGPSKLPPLEPSPFALRLHNGSGREQQLAWPHDFQLWIVDGTGRRLGNVPTAVEGAYREIALRPGAALDLSIPFDSGLMEGEPFGEYQVFVDLRQGTAGEPRTPSNPITLNWRLGAAEVEQLLQQAAGGSRVGLRNAPLKLLRVYVGEIGSALEAVQPVNASPRLLALRDQLRLASCLKPHAPIPGRVELPLLVAADGTASMAGPAVEDCLTTRARESGEGDISKLRQIISVRRHLGWEIGLDVRPEPNATFGVLVDALAPYFEAGLELAGSPRNLHSVGGTNAPLAITIRAEPVPAGQLLRLQKVNGATVVSVARKHSGSTPASQAQFKPEELAAAPFRSIADAEGLAEWLEAQVQILVLADPELTWSEVIDAVQPVIEQRVPFDMCTLPVGAGS